MSGQYRPVTPPPRCDYPIGELRETDTLMRCVNTAQFRVSRDRIDSDTEEPSWVVCGKHIQGHIPIRMTARVEYIQHETEYLSTEDFIAQPLSSLRSDLEHSGAIEVGVNTAVLRVVTAAEESVRRMWQELQRQFREHLE